MDVVIDGMRSLILKYIKENQKSSYRGGLVFDWWISSQPCLLLLYALFWEKNFFSLKNENARRAIHGTFAA